MPAAQALGEKLRVFVSSRRSVFVCISSRLRSENQARSIFGQESYDELADLCAKVKTGATFVDNLWNKIRVAVVAWSEAHWVLASSAVFGAVTSVVAGCLLDDYLYSVTVTMAQNYGAPLIAGYGMSLAWSTVLPAHAATIMTVVSSATIPFLALNPLSLCAIGLGGGLVWGGPRLVRYWRGPRS